MTLPALRTIERELAGTVPSDVWERLSPIHARLRGIQEPLSEMERLQVPFLFCFQ